MQDIMLMKEIFSKFLSLVRIQALMRSLFVKRYIETSALDSTNVEQAFQNLIVNIYRHHSVKIVTPPPFPSPDPPPIEPQINNAKNRCCFS